jgi:hypothetical protein
LREGGGGRRGKFRTVKTTPSAAVVISTVAIHEAKAALLPRSESTPLALVILGRRRRADPLPSAARSDAVDAISAILGSARSRFARLSRGYGRPQTAGGSIGVNYNASLTLQFSADLRFMVEIRRVFRVPTGPPP